MSPAIPSETADREQLIMGCQGLVRTLAWQIHQAVKGRVELNDLIAYGQVGLAEAAAKFDPNRENRFVTFAYHRIRGSILDGLAKLDWFRPFDFYSGRYRRVADEVLNGADPTENPTDSLEDDGTWLADTSVRLAMVFLVSQDIDGGRWFDLEDQGAHSPHTQAVVNELHGIVRRLVDRLPEQGRRLMQWIYYEGLSLTHAAERMKISKSWVSRLHDRMLRQLAVELKAQRLDSVSIG